MKLPRNKIEDMLLAECIKEYTRGIAEDLSNATESELIELMDYHLNKIYEIGEYDHE